MSAPVVLHVLEAVEAGVGRHVRDLVTHARPARHLVAAAPRRVGRPTDPTLHADLRAAGATVVDVPLTRVPPSPANVRALVALRRLVAEHRVDVVHGHASVGGALARAAALGTPARAVVTPNGVLETRAALLVERALARSSAHVVAVSDGEAAQLRRLGLAPGDRLRVVRNGVDLAAPADEVAAGRLRAAAGAPRGVPLVGCVARLVPQKDPATLAAAWALVARQRPDARFLLVGAGPLAGEVDAALAALPGAPAVRVAAVPHVGAALAALDVFVLPSRYEGAPYAPMEAAAAGVPLVLSDVVGNRDLVQDGVSGRLVPPQDPAALAGAVLGLLADAALAARLAAGAREVLAARHDVRAAGAEHAALYAGLRRG